MTPEEKQLLLKDLCARVIYQPKVYIEGDWVEDEIDSYDTTLTFEKLVDYKNNNYILKPYLRPMSSMTEEERKDFPLPYSFDDLISGYNAIASELPSDCNIVLYFDEMFPIIDWLNAHHFDYRGLIEKGLAIEAPEGMYDIKD